MSTYPKSTWLQDPSDKELIRRSVTGMGSIIVGKSQIEKLADLAETPVQCSLGHVTKLLDVPDSGNCPHPICKGKRNPVMKDGVPLEGLEPDKEDETVPGYSRMVKLDDASNPNMIPAGTLDGKQLYTDTRKMRKPITGGGDRTMKSGR